MFRVIKRRKTPLQNYYGREPNVGSDHRIEWLIFFIFLCGLILGALSVRQNDEIIQKIMRLFENYRVVKENQSKLYLLSNALLKRFILVIGIYCVGLCALGTPVLWFVPLCYGTAIGLVSAYLYYQYALKGIGYCALLLYPGYVLSVFAIILSCAVGIRMSQKILKKLLLQKNEEAVQFSHYNKSYVIILLFITISGVLDVTLYSLFAGYFQFS